MTAADTPRILFQSVPPELKPVFEDLPGLHSYVDGDEEVHPSDHDLLVTFESSPNLDDSWHVLGFGMSTLGGGNGFHRGKAENRAREATVAEGDWASEHRALIQRTILEEIAPVPRRTWQTMELVGTRLYPVTGGDLEGEVAPLVHLGREKAVYAMIATGGQDTLVWALPPETTDHRDWLISVLETLHKVDPDRFPGQAEWRMEDTWAPSALRAALAARNEEVIERDRVLAVADQRIAEAGAEVEAERAAAVAGPWRLLTDNDDSLVDAVRDALEAFGFEVRELDEENHRKYKRRLEDLRVTVPGDEGWESLVEVKGYVKGAKVNDVRQVTEAPSIYFELEHDGRSPAAVWHIVNVERGTDPSLRKPAIPADADLQVLTDARGALIDTRDLFRALRDVESGVATADEVRESLLTALTRWKWSTP